MSLQLSILLDRSRRLTLVPAEALPQRLGLILEKQHFLFLLLHDGSGQFQLDHRFQDVFLLAGAVREVKAGKVEFRTDKTALVHVPVGKISFPPEKLVENAATVITSVIKAKPSVAKGKYIKGCYLSSTMGPGVPIDTAPVEAAARA